MADVLLRLPKEHLNLGKFAGQLLDSLLECKAVLGILGRHCRVSQPVAFSI